MAERLICWVEGFRNLCHIKNFRKVCELYAFLPNNYSKMDTALIGLDPLFSTNVKLFIKDVLALVPTENVPVGMIKQSISKHDL
jgi:hypothetical protein